MDEEQVERIEESRIAELLASEAWALVRERLVMDCEALESVRTLTGRTNEEIGEEARVRSAAIGLVLGWLNEIESIAEAKLQDTETLEDGYIKRLD